MLETLSAPAPPPVNPETDTLPLSTETDSAPSLDLSTQIQPISHPAATSSPHKETDIHQDGGGTPCLDLREESGPLLYLSEGPQESLASSEAVRPETDSGCEANKQTNATGKSAVQEEEAEAVRDAEVEPVGAVAATAEPQQPFQPRKEKLAILKKLGLDPPPVVKLRPDDGAFVKLEPPPLNPGKGLVLKLEWAPSIGYRIFSSTRAGGSTGTISPSHQSTCSHEGGANGAAQHHPQRHHPVGSGGAAFRVVRRHCERQSRGAGGNKTRYGYSTVAVSPLSNIGKQLFIHS